MPRGCCVMDGVLHKYVGYLIPVNDAGGGGIWRQRRGMTAHGDTRPIQGVGEPVGCYPAALGRGQNLLSEWFEYLGGQWLRVAASPGDHRSSDDGSPEWVSGVKPSTDEVRGCSQRLGKVRRRSLGQGLGNSWVAGRQAAGTAKFCFGEAGQQVLALGEHGQDLACVLGAFDQLSAWRANEGVIGLRPDRPYDDDWPWEGEDVAYSLAREAIRSEKLLCFVKPDNQAPRGRVRAEVVRYLFGRGWHEYWPIGEHAPGKFIGAP